MFCLNRNKANLKVYSMDLENNLHLIFSYITKSLNLKYQKMKNIYLILVSILLITSCGQQPASETENKINESKI